MANINGMELQNLRHLIGQHENTCKKLNNYADQASDPQVKQYFQKSAQSAEETKKTLLSFLQ